VRRGSIVAERAFLALKQSQKRMYKRGLLEYLPDPLIPFAGARYRQETEITLERMQGFAGGRRWHLGGGSRERFAYEQLHIEMGIQARKQAYFARVFCIGATKESTDAATAMARLSVYE